MAGLNFLVRMRYDASESTHVKDLTGRYTITTPTGAAFSSAPDPFGGNNALNFNAAANARNWIIYGGNSVIKSKKMTVAFWAYYLSAGGGHNTFLRASPEGGSHLQVMLEGLRPGIRTANTSADLNKTDAAITINSWHYIEISIDNGIYRIFVDGVLKKTGTNSNYNTYYSFKEANETFWIGQYPNGSWYDSNYNHAYIYDLCIMDGVWHTENYNVPTSYIQLEKQGILISKTPINLLDKTAITGITTEGIQPANTTRHVAFKVDDTWKKLTIDTVGGATLTSLSDQNVTADSLILEGNTPAELDTVTSVPGFVGKLVYPAVAMYVAESATVMPTFGMTIDAEIDTIVNTYTYTDYSQEYVLSAEADVPIVSCVADTTTTGNGSVDITARIRQGDTWSEYMSIEAVHMKEANAIQLKAVYNVQTTDGTDSCKIDKVTITYNTAGAIVSGGTTEIVTITQEFTNDLVYVHAYIKHEPLVDAQLKTYCSLRPTPQQRTMYQIGNGTGANRVYQLQDTGVNQDTLMIYVDGNIVQDFSYNTETSQVSLTAPNGSVVSASYEYGWGPATWVEMTKGTSQINDSGNYTTEYTYVIPSHETPLTVTAVKYALIRPEGTVTNEVIGVGTGKQQIIQLPHQAKKETIECTGQWSFDQNNNLLTVIMPEGSDIVVSYDWVAETPTVYDIAAGWAED